MIFLYSKLSHHIRNHISMFKTIISYQNDIDISQLKNLNENKTLKFFEILVFRENESFVFNLSNPIS
jgi:hypothetical protein